MWEKDWFSILGLISNMVTSVMENCKEVGNLTPSNGHFGIEAKNKILRAMSLQTF